MLMFKHFTHKIIAKRVKVICCNNKNFYYTFDLLTHTDL